jgi:hypothetical protein
VQGRNAYDLPFYQDIRPYLTKRLDRFMSLVSATMKLIACGLTHRCFVVKLHAEGEVLVEVYKGIRAQDNSG